MYAVCRLVTGWWWFHSSCCKFDTSNSVGLHKVELNQEEARRSSGWIWTHFFGSFKMFQALSISNSWIICLIFWYIFLGFLGERSWGVFCGDSDPADSQVAASPLRLEAVGGELVRLWPVDSLRSTLHPVGRNLLANVGEDKKLNKCYYQTPW